MTRCGVVKRALMPSVTLGLIVAAMGALPGVATAAGQVITEFTLPNAGSVPNGIAAGPDGNVWFAEFSGNRIGRITPAGVITEFPVPTPNSQPNGIIAGPDKNLWFTEIGRQQDRADHHVRQHHRVPRADAERRAQAHRRGRGRQPLVYRVCRQQDRPDHHRRCDHRVRGPHGRQRPLRDRGGTRWQRLVHRA